MKTILALPADSHRAEVRGRSRGGDPLQVGLEGGYRWAPQGGLMPVIVWLQLAHAAPSMVRGAPAEVSEAIALAADQTGVPSRWLEAIAFEASRFDPDAQAEDWSARGLFGLRLMGEPSLARAKSLAGLEERTGGLSSHEQALAAAALLSAEASRIRAASPSTSEERVWREAARLFAGSDETIRRSRYVAHLEQLMGSGSPPVSLGMGGGDSSLAAAVELACEDNYSDASRTSVDIQRIVVHTTQGSASGAISWFGNCSASVSAHYVVRSIDGHITQTLREEDIGWHAGNWPVNATAIGIEHEGYIDNPEAWYTDDLMSSSAALVRDVAQRHGIPLDRDHIIAHAEVPGCSTEGAGGVSCHTDPGPGWDWDRYMDLITEGEAEQVLQGFVRIGDTSTGAPVPYASVQLVGTGTSRAADEQGYFRFENLAPGEWTVRTRPSGYAAATCQRTLEAGENWCSLAVSPAEDDAGALDTASPPAPDPRYPADGGADWGPTASKQLGCACSAAPPGGVVAGGWLGLLLSGWVRRQSGLGGASPRQPAQRTNDCRSIWD